MITNRRAALQAFGVGLASATAATALGGGTAMAAAGSSDTLMPEGATHLRELMTRLEKARGRRDFKTVPMILTKPDQWDDKAIRELMAYKPAPKQAWDNTNIDGPWLNLMRNSLNAQIWSFKHPNFLAVSLTHGSANLALYDQKMWDKYQITKLAGDKFKTNTLIVETKAGSADPKNFRGCRRRLLAAGQFDPGTDAPRRCLHVVPQRDLGAGLEAACQGPQSRTSFRSTRSRPN